MNMQPFAYATAMSVEEAVGVLDEGCRPLAGGTDLVALMKAGLTSPAKLVNLKTIPELGRMAHGDDGWHIGATTTLSGLAAGPSIRNLACLYEALLQTASPQLRHMATLGGNLLQKPRCWYYRNPLVPCWRKGGQMCYAFRGENKHHVILGGGPCFAVHPSDPAVALVALDATVVLASPDGQRTLPLADFYRRPSRDDRGDNVLSGNELITQVFIPLPPTGSRGTYAKVADRAAWDFALVSVAVQLVLAESVVQRARIALGGVAPIPWRAVEAEQAVEGQLLGPETIAKAAGAAITGARALAHNAYKVDLLRNLVSQALGKLAQDAS